jgi:hypothetical protein
VPREGARKAQRLPPAISDLLISSPASLAVGETELSRNAVVWQPILAAGGLSSPPGGLKGRLQARLPATRSAHIANCRAHLIFHEIRRSEFPTAAQLTLLVRTSVSQAVKQEDDRQCARPQLPD